MSNMNILSLYAISPVHAGSEASTGAVDNPIQREVHTNWPFIQANGVKGAIRDHFRQNSKDKELINYIFGSDQSNDGSFNGAKDDIHGSIIVSDAKLLCFPMRSNIAPFVWVTCPAVLKRFNNDLAYLKLPDNLKIQELKKDDDAIAINWKCDNGKIILEDAVVNINKEEKIDNKFFEENFPDIEKLLLISDDMFKYCVDNGTEIQTQIKIDEKTGTAKAGALRYSEYLPSDSLMYSIVMTNHSKAENELKADAIRDKIKDSIKDFIQIGGDQTLGRGIFKTKWIGE